MTRSPIIRRDFVRASLAAPLLNKVRRDSKAVTAPSDDSAQFQLYWRDLYNYSAFGYRPDRKRPDWYCVRVLEHNHQMALSSPIWVG